MLLLYMLLPEEVLSVLVLLVGAVKNHSNDYGGFSWKVSQRVCRGVFVGFSDCLYKLSIYCILNKTVSIGLVHVGHKDKLRQS